MSKRALEEVDLTLDDAVAEKKGVMSCCVCMEVKNITLEEGMLCRPGSGLHGMCATCLIDYKQQIGSYKCPVCKEDMRMVNINSPEFLELMCERTPFDRLKALWTVRRRVWGQVIFGSGHFPPVNELPGNSTFLQWVIEYEYDVDCHQFLKWLTANSASHLEYLLFRKDTDFDFSYWLLNESCLRGILQIKEVKTKFVSRRAIDSGFSWALDCVSPSESKHYFKPFEYLSADFVCEALMTHYDGNHSFWWANLVWNRRVRPGDLIKYSDRLKTYINAPVPLEIYSFIGSKLADKAETWRCMIAHNEGIYGNVLMALVHSWRPPGAALEYPLAGSQACVAEFSMNLLVQHDGQQFTGPVGRCFTEKVEVKEPASVFSGDICPYLTIATDPLADNNSPVIITYPSRCYKGESLAVILLADQRIRLLVSTRVTDLHDHSDILFRSIATPQDGTEDNPYHPIIEIKLDQAAVYRFTGFFSVKIVDLREMQDYMFPVFPLSF